MSKNSNINFNEIIAQFSEKFHQPFLGEHRTASPLGAWCLLAFLAADDANPHPAVLDNLGCSTTEAKQLLLQLIKERPEVVAMAVNSWINPTCIKPENSLHQWINDVAVFGSTNIKIPTNDELNAWVKKESLEIIEEFPVTIDNNTFVALFATVIATDITWDTPYAVTQQEDMTSAWTVDNTLVRFNSQTTFIHEDSQHGFFAVHSGLNEANDLNVYSIIPLSSNVSEAETMAVARSVALGKEKRVPLASLPLGSSDNGVLLLKESISDQQKDTLNVWLPAWETNNKYDLKEATLSFEESINNRFNDLSVGSLVEQVCIAKYNALGFKAAALTYAILARAAMPSFKTRKAEIKFIKPHAVVAVTHSDNENWDNLTIFDGWVSQAVEAEEPEQS